MIPATYDATKHYKNPQSALCYDSSNLTISATPFSMASSSSSASNTNPFTGATTGAAATIAMTINTSKLASTSQQSQIPSYYGGTGNHPQRSNSFHKQHQQQQQQPSQLPQSLNHYNSSSTTINYNQGSMMTTTAASATTSSTAPLTGSGNGRAVSGSTGLERMPSGSGPGGGSGSSSATSSSPLSPPSITSFNIKDQDTKLVNEMHKLCRKSPFMPKKFNGSSSYNRYNTSAGGGDESPKKESVLSSIGNCLKIIFNTSNTTTFFIL